MKKNLLQFTLGLLVFLAILILAATAYLSYHNLSAIVTSLKKETVPEYRLVTIQEISRDIEKAGNSIRLYTLTRDTNDLIPYYDIISGIDDKVNRLKTECSGSISLLSQIDTISKRIEESIFVWNRMLYLSKSNSVAEYLKQLSDKINAQQTNNAKSEKGILKKVFSRKSREDPDNIDIKQGLKDIEKQEHLNRMKLSERESELARLGYDIKDNLFGLISEMESEIMAMMNDKTISAGRLADETYVWLIVFTSSGGILGLILLILIIRFIKTTKASQTALENSKREAENLAHTKEMFMANMSHEIRTPVTAISGFTEQLLNETHDNNIKPSLQVIKSSSDNLLRIINDILDFSKLQNNMLKLEKEHFLLKPVINDILKLFESAAISNNNKLSCYINPRVPDVILGDPYRLKQVIMNLVSNSVKFTKEGEIRIEVNCIIKGHDSIMLILEVSDTGIGIDESNINKIFDDFIQAEASTTRKFGGTGLGLSIVKKIIELHQGTIICKSVINRGTIITCNIPYLTGDKEKIKTEISAPLSVPDEIKDLRILIVEDEEYNRMLFKKIFEKWEIKYDEAKNGNEAIEKLRDSHFNLLFMDLRMPELDGVSTTRHIRKNLRITESEMPIVCISAAITENDGQTKIIEGMNAMLQKPFTEEMLLNVIAGMIRKYPEIFRADYNKKEKIQPHSKDKINLQNLYHISEGDEQFVKQMLNTFIFTTRKGIAELIESVSNGEKEKSGEIAHKLLAPCRHIGAMDLYNILSSIEKACRQNRQVETMKSMADDSMRAFEKVQDLIKAHLSESDDINGKLT
jgi:signal transduction histidine kinase/FixJ family two-component response regulator/CHASE3 domain sensor protein